MHVVQSEGEKSRGPDPKRGGPIVVRDVICPGCADLCDDLELTIEGDRIVNSPLPTDEAVLLELLSRLRDRHVNSAPTARDELRVSLRHLKGMRGLR